MKDSNSTPEGIKGFIDEVVAGIESLGIRYNHPEHKWLADMLVSISVGEATVTKRPERLDALLKECEKSLGLKKASRSFYETPLC